MERRDKTVAESRVETIHLVMPSDMNDSGRLFGGCLMCWIDEVAGLVGRRHAQMNVTTGSVDNLRFLRGAYLTMVGLDENDKPCRLPRLILETEEDEREWQRAQTRRDIRSRQNAEGFHFYEG